MTGIIVGIDGSDHSQRALEWAVREAAIRDVPLTVIAVYRAVGAGTQGRGRGDGKGDSERRRRPAG